MSLGIRWTTKVVWSIASIFVFTIIAVIMSWKSDISVFANGSLGIKEVDDAYISLDGAILDSNTDFGARFAYIVKPWDTLDTIAREFGITVKSLTDNNGLSSNIIKPWQELIISSVDWFVYDIKETTTIRDFALKYKLDLQDLKELNALQNDHDILQVNDEVFVPLTLDEWKLLWLIIPDPEPQAEEIKPSTTKPVIKKNSSNTTKSVTKKTPSKSAWWVWRVSQSRAWCFGFVPGQCTCYAAQKRPDIFVPWKWSPWRWNARQWYNNAKAAWYSVWTKASIWSIAVMSQWWGWYWHVGIVIDVSDDSVLLESMNWVGPYIVNRIWIDKSRIRWYIY
jgi:surface antigen